MNISHQVHITFNRVEPQPFALDRIVSMCRTRSCGIARLEFSGGEDESPAWARLTVTGEARRLRLLSAKLAAMVDVASVVVNVPRPGSR
jgi:acetolactate synthase regulatory subunit